MLVYFRHKMEALSELQALSNVSVQEAPNEKFWSIKSLRLSLLSLTLTRALPSSRTRNGSLIQLFDSCSGGTEGKLWRLSPLKTKSPRVCSRPLLLTWNRQILVLWKKQEAKFCEKFCHFHKWHGLMWKPSGVWGGGGEQHESLCTIVPAHVSAPPSLVDLAW